MANLTFVLAATTIAITLCNAQLYIIEAGTSGRRQKGTLSNDFTFCPSKFSAKGFSVECVLPKSAKGAKIYVNGKPQVEKYAPYLAGGNRGKTIFPLKGISAGKLTVKCIASDKTTHNVTGTIACTTPKPALKKPVAPPRPVPRPLQTKKDGGPEEKPPMMVREGSKPVTTKKAAPVAPTTLTVGKYCIYKPGTSHSNKPLPKGWVAKGTAVTYRPTSDYGGTVPSSTAILSYKFTPTYTSTYAVTLDMGTKHPTEHNDVFVRCQGGFTAMKSNGKKFPAPGFVKAYHNKNGRATQAFTKDKDAHALSTTVVYKKGVTYTCDIGARSTKTTIYGLVLFPCNGMECQTGSKVWKTGITNCTPQ